MRKNAKRIFIIDVLILIVVAIALGVSMIWARDIELASGLLYEVPADSVDESEIVTLNSGVHVSSDGGSDGLYIDYLDVGQGDCTIIRLPDGKTMIIDAGKPYNAVKSSISSFIDKTFDKDFKYFDYAILTHPDDDHCGSWGYVLDMYPARVGYRPNVEATNGGYSDPAGDLPKDKSTEAYKTAIQAMYKEIDGEPNVVYVTDPSDEKQTISSGEGNDKYTFTFYSPLSSKYSDDNNYSPIMILSYRGLNFALSGDAEANNEKEFVQKVESARTDGVTDKYDIFTDDYTVNAIKCGHHGSKTSTSQAYIDAITTPDGAKNAYYIISCGEGNTYKHPHAETLDRLTAMGVPEENVLRTDLSGNITLSVRVDDNGEYNLYVGDKNTGVSGIPNDPDDDPGGDDNPGGDDDNNNGGDDNPGGDDDNNGGDEQEPDMVFVYRKLGSIRLTWAVVAWSCYAVLVVLAAAHIVWVSLGGNAVPKAKGGGRK